MAATSGVCNFILDKRSPKERKCSNEANKKYEYLYCGIHKKAYFKEKLSNYEITVAEQLREIERLKNERDYYALEFYNQQLKTAILESLADSGPYGFEPLAKRQCTGINVEEVKERQIVPVSKRSWFGFIPGLPMY
jgi:hypothetical protein